MANATERPTSSETTGPRSLGSVALSVIGQRRGEIGSVVVPMSVPAIAAEATAEEVDRGLEAALPTTLKSRIAWNVSKDFDRLSVAVRGVEDLSDDDVIGGLGLVLGACRPTAPRFVIQELAKCDAVTKARQSESHDQQVRIAVFTEDLREFPPDVVAAAFMKWRRLEKFAPSVAEIRDLCWRALMYRDGLKRALVREAERRGMEIRT